MATTAQKFINKHQPRRSSLRSSSKLLPQDYSSTGCSSDQKVIEQIKKQIEHQQIINASLSTYPVAEDMKAQQEQLVDLDCRQNSDKKALSAKIRTRKQQSLQMISNSAELSQEGMQISLQQQLKSKQAMQSVELSQNTPVHRPNLKPHRNSQQPHRNSQQTPYKEDRVNYRKKRGFNSTYKIPFRKHYDQFESKIVSCINKTSQGKSNEKDVEALCEKIQKISYKDMLNPFVVSGIQTILNLMEKKPDINITSVAKLKHQVSKLSQKIWDQLSCTNEYEDTVSEQKKIDISINRPRIMRKIYKMLIQSCKYNFDQAREKSYDVCELFFKKHQNQISEIDVVSFIKDHKLLGL